MTTNTEPLLSVWTGKHKKNWNSIITPESFSHPAKFARGLLETIVEHALEEGWVKPGDHCIDPFGGIATGAWACLSNGLRWTGCELEEHFHNLGQGCDCTGLTRADYVRFYARWPHMRYAEGRYWCPRCLAQVAQVTGERRPTQRTFRTQPRPGRKATQRTVAFLALPLPDRRDGWRPPRTQALFAAETASYARNSGVIPHTQAHHYQGNIEAWAAKGYTGATLLRGDSRRLTEVLNEAGLSISSPPYAGVQIHRDREQEPYWETEQQYRQGKTQGQHSAHGYGQEPGQLCQMTEGSLDAALAPDPEPTPQLDLLVSSSPYADGCVHDTGQDPVRVRQQGTTATPWGTNAKSNSLSRYGTDPAQLANLPEGSIDATIASPPYADGCTHTGGADPQPQHVQGGPLRWVQYGADCTVASPPYAQSLSDGTSRIDWSKKQGAPSGPHTPGKDGMPANYSAALSNLGNMPAGDVAAVVQGDCGISSPPFEKSLANGHFTPEQLAEMRRRGHMPSASGQGASYGETNGQLGATTSTTFWEAARTIVAQTFQILKPGAHAIWVTKHYIRDGALVDFPGDWRRLTESVGFQTVHIHLAMLVERRVETHLFEGETTYEQWTESFFRRLSRRKTGLGIEFETVICQVKPHTAAPMPPDEAWQQLPLVEVTDGAECSVSSPSYGGNAKSDYLLSADGKTRQRDEKRGYAQGHGCFRGSETYGQTDGQLGAMKVGSLADCLISSSPYAGAGEVLGTHNGIDWTKAASSTGHRLTPGREIGRYSGDPANLCNLPEGQRP